jgi:hypothetical protein
MDLLIQTTTTISHFNQFNGLPRFAYLAGGWQAGSHACQCTAGEASSPTREPATQQHQKTVTACTPIQCQTAAGVWQGWAMLQLCCVVVSSMTSRRYIAPCIAAASLSTCTSRYAAAAEPVAASAACLQLPRLCRMSHSCC